MKENIELPIHTVSAIISNFNTRLFLKGDYFLFGDLSENVSNGIRNLSNLTCQRRFSVFRGLYEGAIGVLLLYLSTLFLLISGTRLIKVVHGN